MLSLASHSATATASNTKNVTIGSQRLLRLFMFFKHQLTISERLRLPAKAIGRNLIIRHYSRLLSHVLHMTKSVSINAMGLAS